MDSDFITIGSTVNDSLTGVLSACSSGEGTTPVTLEDSTATLATCVAYAQQQCDIEEAVGMFRVLIQKDMREIAVNIGIIRELDTYISSEMN